MHVVLNEHERREVRAGLWLRRQEMERLQKTVARSGLAAATRELESRLELVDALLRATATEDELAEMDGRDPRQLEIPAAGEPQPVDAEALCPHEHVELEPGQPERCVDCGAEVEVSHA